MRPGSFGGRIYEVRRTHTAADGGGRVDILKGAKRVARINGGGGGGGGFMQDQTISNTNNVSKHALTITSANINGDRPLSVTSNTTLLHGDSSNGNNISVFDNPWEFVDNYFDDHDDISDGYDDVCDDANIFGRVPSSDEVDSAILSLQRIIDPASPSTFSTEKTYNLDKDVRVVMEVTSSKGSDNALDWVEPSVQIRDQRSSVSSGLDRVYDAVRLLQTEPKVLRMVKSVSTDGAVWNAIMNNEVVREIRDSFLNETNSNSSNGSSNVPKSNPNILKWMFDNMKAKLMEVIGTITQFLGEMLRPLEFDNAQNSDMFVEKLNTMFMLSVVVLLIVVATRAHNG